jgi:hypothetical protein
MPGIREGVLALNSGGFHGNILLLSILPSFKKLSTSQMAGQGFFGSLVNSATSEVAGHKSNR